MNYMRATRPFWGNVLYWQHDYRMQLQASDALHALYVKRRGQSVERDAIWEGYYALHLAANARVSEATAHGMLLTMFYKDAAP